mmetsp:Transcript_5436/g.7577  ORF Transcript_5436/g.7577 Transcript_5436/m.7577 type:complete len:106 (-) Transcript_5436:343-660(-)
MGLGASPRRQSSLLDDQQKRLQQFRYGGLQLALKSEPHNLESRAPPTEAVAIVLLSRFRMRSRHREKPECKRTITTSELEAGQVTYDGIKLFREGLVRDLTSRFI